MPMLTINQLTRYANKFLREEYNLELTVPIQINGRLKSTFGRFVYIRQTNKPLRVEMNKIFVTNNPDNIVLDVLKHELVHYVMCLKGLPFSDGSVAFERELSRLGVVSQKTINKYNIKSRSQFYQCAKCNEIYKMSRRLKNNGRYHSCTCGGKLIDRGKRVTA